MYKPRNKELLIKKVFNEEETLQLKSQIHASNRVFQITTNENIYSLQIPNENHKSTYKTRPFFQKQIKTKNFSKKSMKIKETFFQVY